MDEASLIEHEEVTKVKNIRFVTFGPYKMECWYFSPYPEEIWNTGPVDTLYVCEFTFRFFKAKGDLLRHFSKPNLQRHPPGELG
jgi:histone acetyltransferase MYST1